MSPPNGFSAHSFNSAATIVCVEKSLTVIKDEDEIKFASSVIKDIHSLEEVYYGEDKRDLLLEMRKTVRSRIDGLKIVNRTSCMLRLLEMCVSMHIDFVNGHDRRLKSKLLQFDTAFRKFDYKYL